MTRNLDAHVCADDAHQKLFARHNEDKQAHALLLSTHNTDADAHKVIQQKGLFSMFSLDQLQGLDNEQLQRALEDLHKVQQTYAAKSAQATALLQQRGVATAGAMKNITASKL